jgi:hypothetical protein
MKSKKILIFDASSIISLAMNCLLHELRELKKNSNDVEFVLTREVQYEVIERPKKIKRFALEALKSEKMFKERIFVSPSSLGFDEKRISSLSDKILQKSNNIFSTRKRDVHLIDKGEASCLALNKMALQKNFESVIVVDERTTRLLGEKPQNLERLMERKLKMDVKQNKSSDLGFEGFKFIRSTELIYIAHKRGLTRLKGNDALDAMLWGLKFKGAAISGEEINELRKLT